MCTHFKRLLYAPARKKPYGIVTLGSDRYRNIRNMCHPLPDTTGSYLADAPLGVHLFHARLGSPHLSSSAGAYDLLCSPTKLFRPYNCGLSAVRPPAGPNRLACGPLLVSPSSCNRSPHGPTDTASYGLSLQ